MNKWEKMNSLNEWMFVCLLFTDILLGSHFFKYDFQLGQIMDN